MRLRGGEFSTGTMGNFQPELTHGNNALPSAESKDLIPATPSIFFGIRKPRITYSQLSLEGLRNEIIDAR